MTKKNDEIFNPFWDGGAAALLLTTIVVAMFYFLCLPAKQEYNTMKQHLEVAESRVKKKYDTLKAYNIKADEIRRGDPLAIEEAIRKELLKGEEDEYVL